MARELVKKHSSSSLGSIKESMLTEAQFQAQHGTGWVLMDGRDVTGSAYAALTGNTTLPDARGQFLRGKNNGRVDGNENPDGDVALGNYSSDKTGVNGLSIPSSGSHSHSSSLSIVTSVNQNVSFNGGSTEGFQNLSDIIQGGDHTHSLSGDNESAPKNLTVNIFIKINEA